MKKTKSVSQIIATHTLTYFNFLNMVLCVLVLVSGQYKNLLFMGVVISNALIGIIQELRVKKLIDKLTVLTATKARVIPTDDLLSDERERNLLVAGDPRTISRLVEYWKNNGAPEPVDTAIESLRVGQVMRLSSGDQIACDSIVITSDGMEVDESMLTGESVPVHKKEGNELFSGSHIVAGGGTAVIVHTGEENYASQLVEKARTKKRASSEMQVAINKIIHYVSYALIPIGLTLFAIQYFRVNAGISESLVKTVAGVLGMIPEGLVLLTSISFVLGVGRLAGKKALVQEMESIEALARVDTLCLDKTGTITTGALKVERLIRIREIVQGSSDKPLTKDSNTEKTKMADTDVEAMQAVGMEQPDEMITLMQGIAHAFSETNVTGEALKAFFSDTKPYPVSGTLPFSSRRKYMGVEFSGEGAYVLGAPDFITKEEQILHKSEEYATKGYRVLLLAKVNALADMPSELTGVDPLGLIVLSDCVKDDAPETLAFFRDMGVKIRILSGDNPATVSAVAGMAGLDGAERYIDATRLPEDEEKLRQVVQDYTVFGRVSPEKKNAIIRAFQSGRPDGDDETANKNQSGLLSRLRGSRASKTRGSVVGMVGDGVNDVLALKEADCSIAMANGADAARQTAHIVLTDSNFSSMKNIVTEGRTIIANIERVSALYLTKTIYSMLLCVIFIIIGKNYPFIPIQLSLIGATAIGIPSFLLALETHDEPVISGFLRHVLRISLPGAIGMVIVTVTVQILDKIFSFGPDIVSTMNMYLGGAVSLCVLVYVCKPMTKRRFVMCAILTVLFVGACVTMPAFFDILPVLP
ncbi:MAG: HAD-IC family P-type ATPase [Eubacterium sp.]|nr:HAD-IC family P-type ATPase [Eubacterium sp.]